MKKLFAVLVIILSISLFSQTLNSPVSDAICSDYGPRYINSKYNWHGGIDYLSPAGTDVNAVEGGNVSVISKYSVFNHPVAKLVKRLPPLLNHQRTK